MAFHPLHWRYRYLRPVISTIKKTFFSPVLNGVSVGLIVLLVIYKSGPWHGIAAGFGLLAGLIVQDILVIQYTYQYVSDHLEASMSDRYRLRIGIRPIRF